MLSAAGKVLSLDGVCNLARCVNIGLTLCMNIAIGLQTPSRGARNGAQTYVSR